MKKIIITVVVAFSIGLSIAQTDANGNPVFNSITTAERAIDDVLLISNYYTLRNNIENRGSSVFVTDTPTLDQIEHAAVNLPSDFFILTKDSRAITIIMLENSPERTFTIIEMATNQQSAHPCTLTGNITANRALELLEARYDSHANLENNVLSFNGKTLSVIPGNEIENAVVALITEKKLDKKKPSDIIIPSKSQLAAYILEETKEGGELDFFTEIIGKENDGIQIKPGVFSTRISIALYKWGRACF